MMRTKGRIRATDKTGITFRNSVRDQHTIAGLEIRRLLVLSTADEADFA